SASRPWTISSRTWKRSVTSHCRLTSPAKILSPIESVTRPSTRGSSVRWPPNLPACGWAEGGRSSTALGGLFHLVRSCGEDQSGAQGIPAHRRGRDDNGANAGIRSPAERGRNPRIFGRSQPVHLSRL